jgi:hypothetical protein
VPGDHHAVRAGGPQRRHINQRRVVHLGTKPCGARLDVVMLATPPRAARMLAA